VEFDKQPHLVFVATKPIDVGDELLFDYNDKQSKAAFLKSCPVCGNSGSRKRLQPEADDPPAVSVVADQADPAAAADAQPSTSKVKFVVYFL